MLAVTLVLSQVCAAAPFTISNTLGDHAVLQNPIIIWGTGVPGETISTTVAQDQWHQKEVRSAQPTMVHPRLQHLLLARNTRLSLTHVVVSFLFFSFLSIYSPQEYTCIVGADGVWRQPLETLGVVTAHNTPG